MSTNTMNNTFDPQTLADDFLEVRCIYAECFDTLDETSWDKPVKGGSKEWTLHETIAHLCALNGAGLESIQNMLRGKTYSFSGLDSRHVLNSYNHTGIDEHLDIPIQALRAKLLGILDEAASIACSLQPSQAEQTAQLPIYNNYKKYRYIAL